MRHDIIDMILSVEIIAEHHSTTAIIVKCQLAWADGTWKRHYSMQVGCKNTWETSEEYDWNWSWHARAWKHKQRAIERAEQRKKKCASLENLADTGKAKYFKPSRVHHFGGLMHPKPTTATAAWLVNQHFVSILDNCVYTHHHFFL